ncbi:hypothetical protein ACLI1A_08055 [Flavobacterium sp. RHBU_3]|uniref:hypothetical protein n=1 Tax=Flavobacterium sp. RHBU_3 TaxID=3391184 RepID=UPI0039850064
MERIYNSNRAGVDPAAISYEKAALNAERSVKEAEELSCSLQLKNLLLTNLRLLKLNDLRSIIF